MRETISSPVGAPDVSVRASSEPNRPSRSPDAAPGSPGSHLRGRLAAVLLFSYYPSDPRPRRAAEALVREGMQVELICLRRSTNEPAREVVNGVDVLRLPFRRRRGAVGVYLGQYALFLLITFVLLAARSLRRRIALVHVHNMPDVLVFSALVPKALGAKVILDLHDPMPELLMTIFRLGPGSLAVRLLKRLERWSVAFADVVFTVNVACREVFASRGCHQEKIRVVMNTPDEAIFALRAPASAPRDGARPFVLVYHGTIVERGGLDLAVAALTAVRRSVPGSELRVYGHATPFLDAVMDQVRRRGLEGAVRYVGEKSLEEVVAAIDDCDVGIIPNRRSPFGEMATPTRIFEYLARGKPVVTTRAQGVRDYFAEDTLFFCEPEDADDLARVVAYVFEHPEETERAVRRGQEVYLAHRWSEERRGLVTGVADLLAAGAR
jgi:glycosyltransferase involved in cell wall biosynthesis